MNNRDDTSMKKSLLDLLNEVEFNPEELADGNNRHGSEGLHLELIKEVIETGEMPDGTKVTDEWIKQARGLIAEIEQ